MAIDYDTVADRYGRRYELHDYRGVGAAVIAFAGDPALTVAEIGCGSGHWLHLLSGRVARLVGLDPSRGMLAHARADAPAAWIVRATATPLPFREAVLDRIVCVNALHHFGDRRRFFREARRTLRPGGGLLTVGLDPHTGRDRWWVYDYFDRTHALDAARLPPSTTIRGELADAGFPAVATREVDRIEASVSLAAALASGVTDRGFTSQLMMLSDAEYARGLARMQAVQQASGAEPARLLTDLHLYATEAWA